MKIPKIDYKINESLTDLFERNKEIVFDRFYECINDGFINELSDVVVFELGETSFFLEANILDWNDSLDCCITYFSIIEDYEKCIDCQKLKTKISNRLMEG